MLNFYTQRFSTQRTPERQMNILDKNHDRKAFKALKWAFPYTIPIFAGFWFLGIAYGIYANASGFSFVYPLIMSMTIYGGSLEFIKVSMLLSPFAPVQTLIMAIMIQARHCPHKSTPVSYFQRQTPNTTLCAVFGQGASKRNIQYACSILP